MNALSNAASLTLPGTIPGVASVDSLFASYRSRLFRLAYRITGNREDAEDAVQETLYRVATKAHQFRGQSQFSTWLTRIAINQALTCLRQRKRDRSVSLDEYLAGDDDSPDLNCAILDSHPMLPYLRESRKLCLSDASRGYRRCTGRSSSSTTLTNFPSPRFEELST